jgi:hypothetical protein
MYLVKWSMVIILVVAVYTFEAINILVVKS